MKKFRIVVNGQSYEVEVEEVNQSRPVTDISDQKEGKNVTAAEPVKQSGLSTPKTGSLSTPGVGEIIKAPLPGKIIALNFKIGDQVRAGDVVAILEAMKMENEIMAAVDGTVREIMVSNGINVNPGEPIMVIG